MTVDAPTVRAVCIGPAPSNKGGIAQYNTSLVRAYHDKSVDVSIVAWKNQYPFFIPRDFIDRSSRSNLLDGTAIPVEHIPDFNNPWSWGRTARHIAKKNPDIVHVHWYNPTQGIPLAVILKKLRNAGVPRIILDLHLVQTKEKSNLDEWLTKRTLKHATDIIVHGKSVRMELEKLMSTEIRDRNIRIIDLFHPIYSVFAPNTDLDIEALKQALGLRKHVFLFFGFIRKYKGLHNCIEAFKLVSGKRNDISLLICGESFWDTLDERKLSVRIKKLFFRIAKTLFLKKSERSDDYNPLELLSNLDTSHSVVVKNEFIPNEDVHKYFQVSDTVLLLYENSTPSGVESLAYNFGLPIVATDVGNFPETVIPGKTGYLARLNDHEDMAAQMEKSIDQPISTDSVREQTKSMNWNSYVTRILSTSKP